MNGTNFSNDLKAENELFEACKQVDFLTEQEKLGMMPRFFYEAIADDFEFKPKRFENMVTAWIPSVGPKSRCQIIFCGLIRSDWIFDKVTDIFTLYNAIDLFIQKVGVMPSNAYRTAEKLIETTMTRKLGAVADDAKDYFKVFSDKRDADIIYLRPLDMTERGKKYIHAFDKRQAYLSACSSMKFGETKYEIIHDEIYTKDADFIGLCDVEFKWKKQINKPFFAGKIIKDSGLFYTPELEFYLQFTDEIKIKSGYVWRKKDCYKTLEKFYKILSKAKKETGACDELSCQVANAAVKKIYTKFFGWLRSEKNADHNWNKKFFRPDWRGLIISLSTANLLRNGLEIQNKFNCKPFCINHDLMLFMSDEPDALAAFENSCLTDANKFSHEWTIEADKVFDANGKTKLNFRDIDNLGKANA